MAKLQFKESNVVYENIIADLRNKNYKPIYLLMGEEDLYIDKICDEIEKIHSEESKVFDLSVFYCKDTNAAMICDTAKRYPMMSKHNVVIVKDAQNITNFEAFESYVKKPNPSSILVLCCKGKTLDKRTGFYKAVQKIGQIYESGILYENHIPAWIKSYAKNEGYKVAEDAAVVMADYLGNSLSKLANELEKLFIVLGERKNIALQDIEDNIGISKDYNVFELSKAVMQKNFRKTQQIINYIKNNPADNPFVLCINALFSQINKSLLYCLLKKYKYNGGNVPDNEMREVVNAEPYFKEQYENIYRKYRPDRLINAVALLREFDLKSKGLGNVSSDDSDLLKELCFKIMH